jgi:hypothetical protein
VATYRTLELSGRRSGQLGRCSGRPIGVSPLANMHSATHFDLPHPLRLPQRLVEYDILQYDLIIGAVHQPVAYRTDRRYRSRTRPPVHKLLS